jgi:mediator of RNA polymerase II transcription subunit 18
MMASSTASASGSSSGAAPVIQGIDTLTNAMSSNIIPDQEYLLQGSILDAHVDVLKHRLRGLCDNVDSGQETFHERELVYSIQGTTSQPLNLRVRRSVDPVALAADVPWQLRYIGQPELGNRPTIVRSCYDIACSDNAVEFLTELGCRLEFEYVAKGFLFRKGRMKVTVSKIFKPPPLGAPSESNDPLTNSHLVELSVLAPSGGVAVADDMKNFAEQLRPLVILDKIDPRRGGM